MVEKKRRKHDAQFGTAWSTPLDPLSLGDLADVVRSRMKTRIDRHSAGQWNEDPKQLTYVFDAYLYARAKEYIAELIRSGLFDRNVIKQTAIDRFVADWPHIYDEACRLHKEFDIATHMPDDLIVLCHVCHQQTNGRTS